MDIELLAQTLALTSGSPARQVERQIAAGANAGKLSQSDQTIVLTAYRLCWRLQAAARLLSDKPLDPAALGIGGQAFLLRETGYETAEALSADLAEKTGLAEAVISAHLKG